MQDLTPLDDVDRRAEWHEARQLPDLRVGHADAAVRGTARDEARLVGAVDAHDAAARPLRQPRVRRRAKGDRPVGRAEPLQPLANPEVPGGRLHAPTADADRRAPDLLAVAVQRRPQRPAVDPQRGVDHLVGAECLAPHPALAAVGPHRQAHLHPLLRPAPAALEHEVDLRETVLGPGPEAPALDLVRATAREDPSRRELVRVRPARHRALVRELRRAGTRRGAGVRGQARGRRAKRERDDDGAPDAHPVNLGRTTCAALAQRWNAKLIARTRGVAPRTNDTPAVTRCEPTFSLLGTIWTLQRLPAVAFVSVR